MGRLWSNWGNPRPTDRLNLGGDSEVKRVSTVCSLTNRHTLREPRVRTVIQHSAAGVHERPPTGIGTKASATVSPTVLVRLELKLRFRTPQCNMYADDSAPLMPSLLSSVDVMHVEGTVTIIERMSREA